MYKLGVLLSGRGSNFLSILENIQSGYIKNAEISVVISNKKDARGLRIAQENNIDAFYIEYDNPNRASYDRKIAEKLKEYGVDFVILAGYMRILSEEFIKEFEGKIINIHPALLPSFRGLHAQRQALEKGVKFSGATVHFVTNELDDGAIIIQSVVPVFQNDTEDSLSKRILATEHKIYSKAIKYLTDDRIKIKNNRVIIDNVEEEDFFYINPNDS